MTYTAGGTEYVVNITVNDSTIPQSGDSGSPLLYVLLGLSALCGIGALILKKKRNHA